MNQDIDCSNIKIELFRNEISQEQNKLNEQKEQNSKMQNELDKIENLILQCINAKANLLEEISEQKSSISLLKNEIEIKKKYLEIIIKEDNHDNEKVLSNQKEKIQTLLSSINEMSIKCNLLIESKSKVNNLEKLLNISERDTQEIMQRLII